MNASLTLALQYHEQIRKNILALTESMSLSQLNQVPEGMNNNLIWNAGHVIATQELLVFALGGHRTPSGKDFINRYRKGTRPEGEAGAEEYGLIRAELLDGHRRLREACTDLDWSAYNPYETSFGITLSGLEEAVEFNNLHEAMHFGTMIALRRLV
ncbi:DinB family protein [Neolewinella litorea]|uniref:DinB family protein n=1 Tax=Neolewinella litorea TaxID=2562452 RepID=A0A4S4NKT6_9BACT|nr:DinB family protein [Neolewinella litorea]THH40516.1 DinB family protein [Neolewinella litorea]